MVVQVFWIWGILRMIEDINNVFICYFKGEFIIILWSEEGFSLEIDKICDQFIKFNFKGWWLLVLQLVVNGFWFSDFIFGWGLVNGFVF